MHSVPLSPETSACSAVWKLKLPGLFFSFLIFTDVFNGDFTSCMIEVWIAMLNSDRKESIYTECGHPARRARLVGPPFLVGMKFPSSRVGMKECLIVYYQARVGHMISLWLITRQKD